MADESVQQKPPRLRRAESSRPSLGIVPVAPVGQSDVISIHVIGGAELPVGDVLYQTSDPFIVIHFGPAAANVAQTKIVPSTLAPQWDQTFEFECNPNQFGVDDTISFVVWDHDTLTAADLLGTAIIKISDVVGQCKRAGGAGVIRHVLKLDSTGTIELEFTFRLGKK